MSYLVTGGAGFVGSHLVDTLLARGEQVICVDNFNDYYDPAYKRRNITAALAHPGYHLVEADIRDSAVMEHLFATYRPRRVAHLAAMAGVRASVARPLLYESVNIGGSVALLELARRYEVEALVMASTSSVYGAVNEVPFVETARTDQPLSPYAATKKAVEILAYTFHQLYGIPTTIARFFTVYGPRGRPDMTPYVFIDTMIRGKPITLFNGGRDLYRDYTYVSDTVAGVVAALERALPFEIINLGNANPVQLCDFVALLERISGYPAQIESKPLPATEPPITFASTSKAAQLLGYAPAINVEVGLTYFWEWYRREVAQ